MNIKDFKSGTLRQEYQYKSFLPEFINHTFTWDDPQINTMLEDATRALGELNAFTMIVPNVDMFIQMHITKEANTSSKIEGTKTEMDFLIVSFGKKAHNASKLLEFLYQRPIISISDITQPLEVSKQTASVLVKEFEEKGILIEITGYERNKLFAFDKYLGIYSQN